MMKTLLVLNIVVFYLLSSIGYASVQHYCTTMQKSMQMSHDDCCCTAEASEQEETACTLQESANEQASCCAEKAENQQKFDVDTNAPKFQQLCCKSALDYNSIDTGTMAKSIDMGPAVKVLEAEPVFFAETPQHDALNSVIETGHPSFHTNLPLII
mgnify:CR=1 FL=1